jgi:Lamin Tail Domain
MRKWISIKLTIVLLLLINNSNAQVASRHDVVIAEIMADPLPVIGLPNAEYVELKNVSAKAFNLNGWRIADVNGAGTIGVNFILQPDSQVIICANASAALFSVFGSTIGVSNFPSLDNDGELIMLRSKEGATIHAIEYNKSWYQNVVKSEGGWSLEMRDTHNPCTGADNWGASIHLKGGTPGSINSINGVNGDDKTPGLSLAFAKDSVTIITVFDERIDSFSATKTSNYVINEGIGEPVSATPLGPLFNTVQLKFSKEIRRNKIYELSVDNITDCSGNAIGSFNKIKTGLPSLPDSFDIVINEILFNPSPDGVDYVELYNRSNRIIDLKDCYLANRNTNGSMGLLRQLSSSSRLLFPGEYFVATEEAALVQRHYLAKNANAFVIISTMPSFPDDKGTVIILNSVGKTIDQLTYYDKWHYKLLNNTEGVALERIDYNKPTQDEYNWHSAATNVNYGTPTYQNSQFKTDEQLKGDITISPAIFSPDNDGQDDVTTFNYQFSEQGYVCNITVFDANGRLVRNLVRNALCGLKGYFRWDGLDEKNHSLPIGVYIVYAEVFNLKGKTKKFKQAITLARRF